MHYIELNCSYFVENCAFSRKIFGAQAWFAETEIFFAALGLGMLKSKNNFQQIFCHFRQFVTTLFYFIADQFLFHLVVRLTAPDYCQWQSAAMCGEELNANADDEDDLRFHDRSVSCAAVTCMDCSTSGMY